MRWSPGRPSAKGMAANQGDTIDGVLEADHAQPQLLTGALASRQTWDIPAVFSYALHWCGIAGKSSRISRVASPIALVGLNPLSTCWPQSFLHKMRTASLILLAAPAMAFVPSMAPQQRR